MAENFVQLPPNSTGTKIRTEELLVAGQTVDQEVVSIGDPSTSGNIAAVTSGNALRVDGSAVTQPVSINATVTVAQPTASNLNVTVGNFPATQPISGTVTANAGSGTFTVGGTVTTVPPSNASTNIAQVAGVNVTTATSGMMKVGIAGATGTTLDAGTAGVLDENIKNVGNSAVATAASGVQKVGIVGNTGSALETTAGVLDENIKNINNAAVATAASGVQKVGIVGNTGTAFETTAGVLDANLKNVGNAAVTLGAKTSANSIPVVLASDEANLPVIGASGSTVTASLTSSTATGLVLTVPCAGFASVWIKIISPGTVTGGSIEFDGVGPNANTNLLTGMRQSQNSLDQLYDAKSVLTITATTGSIVYWFNSVAGYSSVQVYLDSSIVGSGTVTLAGVASNAPATGPTTVGQSDATKLNATTTGALTGAQSFTWNSSSTPTVTIPCKGYGTATVTISTNTGTFTAGQVGFIGFVNGNGAFINGMRLSPSAIQLYDGTTFQHTFVSNQNLWTYWFNVAGYDSFQLTNLTPITGTGVVTFNVQVAVGTPPAPTTVGQSDQTKLNATVFQPTAASLNAAVIGASGSNPTASWTSSTPVSTTLSIPCVGMSAVAISFQCSSGTFTQGSVAIRPQIANGIAGHVTCMRQSIFSEQLFDSSSVFSTANGMAPNAQFSYWLPVTGYDSIALVLETTIGGTGTLTIAARAASPASLSAPVTVGQSDPTKHRVSVFGNAGSFSSADSGVATSTDAVLTVPASTKWIVKGGSVIVVTNATVANRTFILGIRDAGGLTLIQSPALSSASAALNQTASQTFTYNFGPAFGFFMTGAVFGLYNLPFPEVTLGPGALIRTFMAGLQTGDTVRLLINMVQLPD